jgi:signal transduction histidine kinase
MLVILIIISAIYFNKKISDPVKIINNAIKEFIKENLEYRTKLTTSGELGDLARNFDKMANTISHSIKKLKKQEKKKRDFISITAHQLRTPLTGLKWSLDLMLAGETGELNPDQKQLLEKVGVTTHHMIDLVNDLLNVSQIKEGHFGIHLKKQSILPVFENIKNNLQDTTEKKGITLKIDDIPPLPLITIDHEKIEMALENIIDNAIKYSKPRGVVQVKVILKEQEIIISVKDSGIGILPSESDKIFTKFFRSDRALQYHADGTGLGLYVTKHIIDQHRGKVWFESRENEETTFFVSLPIVS